MIRKIWTIAVSLAVALVAPAWADTNAEQALGCASNLVSLDGDWYADTATTHDGSAALRSDAIEDDMFTDETAVLNVNEAGVLSFYYKVSSESGYDTFWCTLDDEVVIPEKSGEVGWTKYTSPRLEAGEHTLMWEYSKDSSSSRGDDCAWVDELTWTPIPAYVTVTFDANGGELTSASSRTIATGDVYGALPEPVRAGYRFIGWYTLADGGTHVSETDLLDSTVPVLYAHWIPEEAWSILDPEGRFTSLELTGSGCWDVSDYYGTRRISWTAGGSTGGDEVAILSAVFSTSRPAAVMAGGWFPSVEIDGVQVAGSWTGNGYVYGVSGAGEHRFVAYGYDYAGDSVWLRSLSVQESPDTFEVAFCGCGAECDVPSRTYACGDTYGVLPSVSMAGCTFLGWSTSAYEETPVAENDMAGFWAPTLFAQWELTDAGAFLGGDSGISMLACADADWYLMYDSTWASNRVVSCTPYLQWYSSSLLSEPDNTVIFEAAMEGAGTLTIPRGLRGYSGNLTLLVDGVADTDYEVTYSDYEGESRYYSNSTDGWSRRFLTAGEHRIQLKLDRAALENYDGVTSYSYVYFGRPQWAPAPESVDITLDAQGGTLADGERSVRVGTGCTYGTLPVPTGKTGWTFQGWYDAPTGGSLLTGDAYVNWEVTTLYAHWSCPLDKVAPDVVSAASSFGGIVWSGAGDSYLAPLETIADGCGLEMTVSGEGILSFDVSILGNFVKTAQSYYDESDYGMASVDCGVTVDGHREGVRTSGRNGALSIWTQTPSYYTDLSENPATHVRVYLTPGTHTVQVRLSGAYAYQTEAFVKISGLTETEAPACDTLQDAIRFVYDYDAVRPGTFSRLVTIYSDIIGSATTDESRYFALLNRAACQFLRAYESERARAFLLQTGLTPDSYFPALHTGAFKGLSSVPASATLASESIATATECIQAALADLARIPENWAGAIRFAAADYGLDEDVYVDRAEVMAVRALFQAMLASVELLEGYSWKGIDYEAVVDVASTTTWRILQTSPDVGRVTDAGCLAAARADFITAAQLLQRADDAVMSRTDASRTYMIEYDRGDEADIAYARGLVAQVIASMDGAQTFDFSHLAEQGYIRHVPACGLVHTVYLGALFTGAVTRDLVPECGTGRDRWINMSSIGDFTFGGILPEMTEAAFSDYFSGVEQIYKTSPLAGLGTVVAGVAITPLDLSGVAGTITFTGLPKGLSYSAKTQLLTGTATVPGTYTVSWTVRQGQTVLDSGTDEIVVKGLAVLVDIDGSEDMAYAGCTVTGAGTYAVGATVKLTAKADRDHVFKGWYRGMDAQDAFEEGGSYQSATISFKVTAEMLDAAGEEGLQLYAYFITAAEAAQIDILMYEYYLTSDYADADGNVSIPVDVESASTPKVTVTGLPKGLAYNATTGCITGKPTVPGLYEVTVKVTSAMTTTGVTFTFELEVPNLVSEMVPVDDMYVPNGEAMDFSQLLANGGTLTVTGLPKGMSWNAKTGMITGKPSTPGRYTVTFTLKIGKNTYVATSTFVVYGVYVTVGWECYGDDTGAGTVSGTGLYAPGGKVTLKATPDKNSVFAGWYGQYYDEEDESYYEYPLETTLDYRTAANSFVLSSEEYGELTDDVYLEVLGSFVSKTRDAASLAIDMPETCYAAEWAASDGSVSIPVYVDSYSMPKVTVTGLPKGLSFNATTLFITGTPTVPGTYKVTVKATNTGNTKGVTGTFELVVYGVDVTVEAVSYDDTGDGKVSGTGLYAPGGKVTLKATPDKNSVFAGWYDENGEPLATVSDYRTAANTYVLTDIDVSGGDAALGIHGAFVSKTTDAENLYIAMDESYYTADWLDASGKVSIPVYVESYSMPKVTVTGLPKGLSFNATTLLITGTPTVPGVYTVTVKATNTGNTKGVTGTFEIEVPNLYDELVPVEDSYVVTGDELVFGYILTDDGQGGTLTVTGLPKGMTYNAKTYTITGSPAAPGRYTVTFTRKIGKVSYVSTATFVVYGVDVTVEAISGDDTGAGTVSGAGLYAAGGKVTLKATADKNSVFAGWYDQDGEPLATASDYRTAANTYVLTGIDVSEGDAEVYLYGLFVSKASDADSLYIAMDESYNTGDWLDASGKVSIPVYVDSFSMPKVTVTGLPKGLSFNATTLLITGTPTVPGVYTVTVKATNTGNTKGVTGTFELTVPNLWCEEVPVADGYVITGDELDFGYIFDDDAGGTLTVTGLPKGMTYNAKTYTITGSPSAPGRYTVYFTRKIGKVSYVSTATFIVYGVDVTVEAMSYDDTGDGTVSGTGLYAAGGKVTLKATADKNSVFAGWYDQDDTPLATASDYRTAANTYTLTDVDVSEGDAEVYLYGLFVSKASDADSLYIAMDESYYTADWLDASGKVSIPVYVDSFSMPKVTVTGLPKGLSFNATTLLITGTPTVPGVYTVTVKATNTGNTKGVTGSFTLTVPNLWCEEVPVADSYVISGDELDFGYILTDDGQGGTLAVTGLPKGMTYNAKTYTITGSPAAPGRYTVTFTRKIGKVSYVSTATFVVYGVDVTVAAMSYDDTGDGTVSGTGLYAAGGKVTLKATPDKNSVFAGWYDGNGEPLATASDYRTAANTYVLSGLDVSEGDAEVYLYGMFVSKTTDAENLLISMDEVYYTGEWLDADGKVSIPVTVESYSMPKVTVTGLPKGLSFNANTLMITGAVTTPGVYTVTVKATNTGNTKGVTTTFDLTVPNLYDEMVPVEDSYIVTGSYMYFGDLLEYGGTLKVTGLPSGMTYGALTVCDASTGLYYWVDGCIYGTPKAAGKYTVTFTLTLDGEKYVSTSTFCVYAVQVSVTAGGLGGDTGAGTVKGGGSALPGGAVTLTATPDKNSVFAGWYVWSGDRGEYYQAYTEKDYRAASNTLSIYSDDISEEDPENSVIEVTACFMSKEDDKAYFGLELEEEYDLTERLAEYSYAYIPVTVESYSLPTVTVTGLPKGLSYSLDVGAIYGSPTEPGTFTVTVTAKNSYNSVTKTTRIIVPNIDSGFFGDIIDHETGYSLTVGDSYAVEQLPCLSADCLGISPTYTVSGLPAGITFRNGVWSGTPTKAGVYTVTLTTKYDGYTFTDTFTIEVIL